MSPHLLRAGRLAPLVLLLVAVALCVRSLAPPAAHAAPDEAKVSTLVGFFNQFAHNTDGRRNAQSFDLRDTQDATTSQLSVDRIALTPGGQVSYIHGHACQLRRVDPSTATDRRIVGTPGDSTPEIVGRGGAPCPTPTTVTAPVAADDVVISHVPEQDTASDVDSRSGADIATAPDGSTVFSRPATNQVLRLRDGQVTVVAGTGAAGTGGDDGPAVDAHLSRPSSLSIAADGTVYIADAGNCRIRAVDPAGTIRAVVGRADRCNPFLDDAESDLAAMVPGEHSIESVDGPLQVLPDGRVAYIGPVAPGLGSPDGLGRGIRIYNPATRTVAPLANDAFGHVLPGGKDSLIRDFALHSSGDLLALNGGGDRVTRINTTTGAHSVFAEFAFSGYPAADDAALSGWPMAATSFARQDDDTLLLASHGLLFRADLATQRVRRIGGNRYPAERGAGGPASSYDGEGVTSISSLPDGRTLFAGEYGGSLFGCVHTIDPSGTRTVQLYAGCGTSWNPETRDRLAINVSTGNASQTGLPDGSVLIGAGRALWRVPATGDAQLLAGNPGFFSFTTYDTDWPAQPFADGAPAVGATTNSGQQFREPVLLRNGRPAWLGENTVWTVDADGDLVRLAGDAGDTAGYGGDGGPGSAALLDHPTGLTVDAGGQLLVADRDNHRIRAIDPDTGTITTWAGTGVAGYNGNNRPAAGTQLNQPSDVRYTLDGRLLVADRKNGVVRQLRADGTLHNIVGYAPERPRYHGPFDPDGVNTVTPPGYSDPASPYYRRALCRETEPVEIEGLADGRIVLRENNNFLREVSAGTYPEACAASEEPPVDPPVDPPVVVPPVDPPADPPTVTVPPTVTTPPPTTTVPPPTTTVPPPLVTPKKLGPVAVARATRTAGTDAGFRIDGSRSRDRDGGRIERWQWVALHTGKTVSRSRSFPFTATGLGARAKDFRWRLTVWDNDGLSDASTVTVHAAKKIRRTTIRLSGDALFYFDSDRLRPVGLRELAKIRKRLQGAESYTVGAHASAEGTDAYNLALSNRRARAMVAYIQRGNPRAPRRHSATGYGERRPVASNATEAGRRKNRRAEITIAKVAVTYTTDVDAGTGSTRKR